MIISGGVNIYPAEIEKELLDHPAIAEVSVMGTADEKWGEVPSRFRCAETGREHQRPRTHRVPSS